MSQQNDFRILEEVRNNLKEVSIREKKRDEEKARIEQITKQIEAKSETLQKALEEKHDSQASIKKLEKELFTIESEMERSNSHISQAKNQKEVEALEHELATLGEKAEKLQGELLEQMEIEESKEQLTTELNEFITGAENSKKEISREVNQSVSELQKEIDSLQSEWKSHARNLTEANKAVLKQALAKFEKSHPFTELSGGSCRTCGYGLDSMLLRSVQSRQNLEICPGCNRIILMSKT